MHESKKKKKKRSTGLSEFGETKKRNIDPSVRVRRFKEYMQTTLSLSLTGRESEVKSFTGETLAA